MWWRGVLIPSMAYMEYGYVFVVSLTGKNHAKWHVASLSFVKCEYKYSSCHTRKWIWKCFLQNTSETWDYITYIFFSFLIRRQWCTGWTRPRFYICILCKVCHISFNTLRHRENGRHYPEDIFKWIFVTENAWILIKISLKFVPSGPINNSPPFVQVMAWHRPGDTPLSLPMMT